MTDDDPSLVARCLAGDAAAVRHLIARLESDVFGLCVKLLHHRHDAEDVVQEVFLRVFRSLKRWDPTRPFKPWVMGITVNRCRTWLSQRSKRPELVEYLQDTAAAPPEDDASELTREIKAAMHELRWEYRSVFVMFHDQGLSYEEIATALEKPVGTVKIWLHRGRLEVLDRLRRRGMVSEVEHELP